MGQHHGHHTSTHTQHQATHHHHPHHRHRPSTHTTLTTLNSQHGRPYQHHHTADQGPPLFVQYYPAEQEQEQEQEQGLDHETNRHQNQLRVQRDEPNGRRHALSPSICI